MTLEFIDIKVCAVLSAMLVMCILISCGNNSIVGIWEPNGSGYEMEFYDDGTMSSKHGTGKYETIDNHLRILDMGFVGQVLSYDYEINGDTLILINDSGIRREYTKKK